MKRYISLLTLVCLCAALFVGCGAKENVKENTKENTENTVVDYSQYPFVDTVWVRDAEHDTETIRFRKDGGFAYYCGCGNPVNDSDLCEGYTYDDATKTVTFQCIETTEEMVTTIKIVKCDENSLHLDFDGEIRIFQKETE